MNRLHRLGKMVGQVLYTIKRWTWHKKLIKTERKKVHKAITLKLDPKQLIYLQLFATTPPFPQANTFPVNSFSKKGVLMDFEAMPSFVNFHLSDG